MMSENSRAVEALEKIAEHEKECAARWAEVAVELRELNQKAHTRSSLGKTSVVRGSDSHG